MSKDDGSAAAAAVVDGGEPAENACRRLPGHDDMETQQLGELNGLTEEVAASVGMADGNGSCSVSSKAGAACDSDIENRSEGNEAVAIGTKVLPPSIVKSEFLAPARVRVSVRNGAVAGSAGSDETASHVVAPDKKSKRQLKRERQLAKKSTEGICSTVARTGDVSFCPYGEKCLYNHDLQGYLEQKPPDLPGKCPSVDRTVRCSYGIACRFFGTHNDGHGGAPLQAAGAVDERNNLSKERQRLLWKNEGSYPKSEATLQAMGLLNKAYKVKGKASERDPASRPAPEETVASINIESSAPGSDERPEISDSKAGTGDNPGVIERQQYEGTPSDKDGIQGGYGPPKRLRTESVTAVVDSLEDQHSNGTHSHGELEAVELASPKDGTAKDSYGSTFRNEEQQSLYNESKLGPREKKLIDFKDKLYLAPLTTVGNLPFRRVCKTLGADITCGEMAMCTNLLQGHASEWALLRRHSSEDLFGVQICGSFPDHVARTAELIEQDCEVSFIDVNMGCPIDLVVNKGAGSCLLTKPQRLEQLIRATAAVMENPLTIKVRVGYYEGRNCAHSLVPNLAEWGVNAVTIHGRTRQQRYSKMADWAYIQQCAEVANGNLQVIGNGDVFSYTDWDEHLRSSGSTLSTCMIARGALVKPWLFQEIKERRHWDISSSERLDILKQYVRFGLEHWGSDSKGVETTRHFLLEWLGNMHRYVPVGLLEVVPQRLNWRPPSYIGRDDLETMMSSDNAKDWVKITELLLGPPPPNFSFTPKHKSNAYDKPENG